jgi:hypothetical protein
MRFFYSDDCVSNFEKRAETERKSEGVLNPKVMG